MITDDDLAVALEPHSEEEMAAIEAALEQQPPVRRGAASDEVLRSYARKPVFSRGEAVAILQGLTPPVPCFGDEKIYYLDEHADVAQRFLADGEAGAVRIPCRPIELLEWANDIGVQLPGTFRLAVERGRKSEAPSELSAEESKSALLTPEGQQQSRETNYIWQRMAEATAKEFCATKKRQPTKAQVARILNDNGVVAEAATIIRRTRNTWSPSRRGHKRRAC